MQTATHTQRADPFTNEQWRGWDRKPRQPRQRRRPHHTVAQAERERRRKLLLAFYGAKSEVTVHDPALLGYTEYKRFAMVKAESGSSVFIEAEKIRMSRDADDATVISSLLLAHSMWGRVRVRGSKEHQMKSVAIAQAYGLPVRATAADQFTAKDLEWIKEKAATLEGAARPPIMVGFAPGHLQLWPTPKI